MSLSTDLNAYCVNINSVNTNEIKISAIPTSDILSETDFSLVDENKNNIILELEYKIYENYDY